MEHLLRLAQATDAPTAARWRGQVIGWARRDTGPALLPSAPVAPVGLFQHVLNCLAAPQRSEHRQLPVMDRAVHRRPTWTYAISMSSRRIRYYEQINNQNKRGWHTGSGSAYLYNDDDTQIGDASWLTADLRTSVGGTRIARLRLA
ncbi:polysaccharide lyase family 8 super-sandwich domain-containing protein [Jiangella asiatica]|nr:polysaccharide lyase family 8 super-sandwich domain-containing protein [Jiangella asiatica]